MYCKNCGKLLSDDARFCSECGTKVVAEAPKPKPVEPIFFTKEREEAPPKPKRVIHLDEFNWDLDGYPTEQKKTEDVDFNWASVLEEKKRNYAPRPVPQKPQTPEPEEVVAEAAAEEAPVETVEELVDALPEEDALVEEAPVEEAVVEGNTELEDEIFDRIEEQPVEEPTRLIDKAQMKAKGVDQFYTFNQKRAELQALLDQEYARILSGDMDEEMLDDTEAEVTLDIPYEAPAEPEVIPTEEPVEEPAEEPAEKAAEEPKEEVPAEPEVIPAEEPAEAVEELAEEPKEEAPAEPEVIPAEEPELVAVVWASAPKGILIEAPKKPETVSEAEELAAAMEALKKKEEEDSSPSTGDEDKNQPSGSTEAIPEEQHKLTFDDIFRDDDEDDVEKEKGGCLKVIAILLVILVIIELGILAVQYFAPDSTAGAYIDQAYRAVVLLIQGEDESVVQEEVSGPSEVQQIISKQMVKNENLVSVVDNHELCFTEGETYGIDEFADTYTFQNSPWYDNEEGESVSFGDEIIGTLIQYYSALADRMNDINKDVFDFIDDTSVFYEEIEAIEGQEDLAYGINNLEIGEIRTGATGFYVMVRLTTVDRQNTEGVTESQIVYLEPDTGKNKMEIVGIQKI